jgi:hypothetical protein
LWDDGGGGWWRRSVESRVDEWFQEAPSDGGDESKGCESGSEPNISGDVVFVCLFVECSCVFGEGGFFREVFEGL